MQRLAGLRLLLLFLLILLPLWELSAQQNPFLSGGDSEQGAEQSGTAYTKTSPFFNSAIMTNLRKLQKSIQSEISGYIREYQSERKLSTLFQFLLFSYLYGLLHVLGPGHRKIFLFTYFISRPTRWRQGMLAGFMTAVLHALSALALIGGLYLITTRALLTRFNDISPILERVSYVAIVVIGIYLLISHIVSAARGTGHTGHSHGKDRGSPDTIMFVLASGLIPCPGAATIMIFSLAVQAPLVGVYAVLAMSLGMASLLIFIPPAAIIFKTRFEPLISGWNPKLGERIHTIISIAGASVLILFGLLFII
ncbi:MAG: hypothetical protein PQJ61_01645 [Spirochaetales bacterium]|uniref:Nickel/cobalt efflux system n=1 Tax=Candidatus Thalassospirochaeta sargassi TaxID=3119039 RepID=A0AAJ1IA40_9SPIO|nr:hypothetical protein [Spirochaetales bacterium]